MAFDYDDNGVPVGSAGGFDYDEGGKPLSSGLYDRAQHTIDTAISNAVPTSTLPIVAEQPGVVDEARKRAAAIQSRRSAEEIDKLGTAGRYFHSVIGGAGAATGTGLNYIGRKFGIDGLEAIGNQMQDVAAARTPSDQSFGEQVAGGIGSIGSSFVAAAPVAAAASSAPVVAAIGGVAAWSPRIAVGLQQVANWAPAAFAGALEAAGNATQTYDEVIAKTNNKELAQAQADKTFLTNLPLNVVLDKFGIFGQNGSAVKKIFFSTAAEATQEGAQQAVGNYFAANPVGEGVTANAAVGGVAGGAIKSAGVVFDRATRPATIKDIGESPTPDDAIAAADAALSAPIDTLSSTIDAFKSEWAADAARVPADSAIQMIGMPEQQVTAQPIALPTDGAPTGQPIETPRAPPGPALLALAEQLAVLPADEQTKALMRLDAPMRQAVVRAMQPSGIVMPDTGVQPGMGEAARITNEATMAASSVQPVGDATVTNVPALTQRAAQELVRVSPGMEMRPHREVANRFEVVPIAGQQTTQASLVPPTLTVPATQQALADEESPATGMPAAPAARPAVPPAPLTAEQKAANQAAADAERSSQPRPIFGQNSQLRSETGPDIKGEKVTRNMRKVLAVMGRITGTKVVFEYAPDDSDGAVPIRGIESNTIHINTASPVNPMQVMGHEVTHVLRGRHAAAWGKVRDALVATMPDKRKGLDDFAANYWGAGEKNAEKLAYVRAMKDWSRELTDDEYTTLEVSRNTIEDFLLDEMVSDLGGKHWTDEKFWLDVFAKIEKAEGAKAKGIIERMVIAIRETLTKFLAVVRAQKQGDYATISPEQIEKTRDAITSAYAEFIRAERRTEPDGEPHVTDHRIGTSDTHSRSSGAEGEPQPATAPVPPVVGDEDELSDARSRELASLSTQRLFFEAAPNPDDKTATQQWREAGRFGRSRIDERVRKVIVPGLLKDLRITGEIMPQLGGWMDATNPSFALVVSKGDPALAARAIGYVLDQQAMYMLGLERFTGAERTGIIHFDITGKDAHKIYMQVRALDTDKISGHSTVGNEMYIGVPFDRMQALRQSVVEIARTNDLHVSFDEGYGATIKEYGYGIQGERQVARGLRTTARDVNKWREQADALRSDAAGRRSDRAGVARKSEQRPSYGESGSGEQVVGVHYSRQQRDVLSSAYFGTGMKAQERARVEAATDPRIKKRLYFYANTGNGIAPESDVGYHAHSVTLNNLYDMDVDLQRLYKTLSAADPYQSPNQLMNDFESGVIDAGFDGYLTREFGKGGAVVLLGAHSVPVQYEGERARPDVPIMPAPKFSDEQALRRKLAADTSLPSGRLTGLEWMNLFIKRGTDFVPRWLDKNELYYRDQLIPRAEPARMSTQRASPWWYSPLARQADAATMKKAPASGWKSWLKSLAAKGVKPDEIKWSGIEEWLDVQGEAVVTKEQVQAYLSEFGVKIETIVRGERSAVTDTKQAADGDDSDIELNVGQWETDEPDEYWLSERASERLDEVVDEKVEAEWEDIADDIQREAHTRIEVSLPDLAAEIRRAMGDMFPVDDELVEQAARNIAAAQVAGDTWQEYHDEDADLTDKVVQIEATDRAFAVLSGDMEALEEEAKRRARAEIDDDELLEELIDQERTWYYDDYDSPQTRGITIDGVDGVFYDSTSYGERNLYYDGHDIPLPRNADDADVEGAIRNYVMEEGLVSGGRGGEFRATKWDGYTTDKNRAVPGSYREVQLTLPVGAFGLPKTRAVEGISYNYYDADGNLIGNAGSEDRAKERAENMGGRYERVDNRTQTDRMSAKDFYYTTHWSEANVIGHARFDEHIDSEGKRVLVLQEVQGDWGQQRREGLEDQEKAAALDEQIDAREVELQDAMSSLGDKLSDTNGWNASDWNTVKRLGSQALSADAPSDAKVAADTLMNITTELRNLNAERRALADDVPDAAPFIEKTPQWAGLVFKRMIAHAIENGFDKVVWTSGAQQVERWRSSLRKQVDTIAWEKTEDGIHIVASQNGRTRTDTRVSETALSDAIGKQMAKQIIADPNQSGEITGDDITISDTGMAGFYDRMLPNIANDILRKFDKDVRVKDIEVHKVRQYSVAPDPDTADRWIMQQDGHELTSESTKERAEAVVEKMIASRAATEIGTQQGFEITDKLRESAANGMPLFSQRRASAEARKSNARKEWYRSQLSEAIGSLPAKIRTGKEAAVWLQANAGKLQIKKDELTWSGVLDWLATQRSVTGAQIQDWLASNGVRVKDVMLGEESEEYRRLDAELQAMDGEIDRLRKAVMDGKIGAAREYGEALNRKNELFEQRKAVMGEQPKYEKYVLVLPGGSQYRELLLTLPIDKSVVYTKDNVVPVYEGDYVTDKNRFWYFQTPDNLYQIPKNRHPVEEHAQLYVINNKQPTGRARFVSSHYKQPNILAHVRFNERTDADGKRVLFIEEVQSDWAQNGRKDGFASGKPALTPAESAEFKRLRDISFANRTAEIEARVEELGGRVAAVKLGQPPLAPFVTDTKAWVALALKRMISHAVDNGFDRVAWTTGEQQAERYDLSKQLRSVSAIKDGDKFIVQGVTIDQGTHSFGTFSVAELPDVVGKDLAEKIANQTAKSAVYKDTDLKVGGEKMDKFYGLPDPTTPVGKDKDGKDLFAIMTVVARSLGATVGTVQLAEYDAGTPVVGDAELDAEVDRILEEAFGDEATPIRKPGMRATTVQPGFDITDKMREQAAVGMPLFSTKRKATPALDQWLGRSVVRKPMYHGTARDITTFRPQQADAIFLTDDPEFAANFADLSHSWMVNNYWTWMSPDQIQQAKRDAMRMLLQDALPGSSLYMREERLLNQSQQPSQYMRRAVEQYMPSESNIMPLYVRAENPFDYRNPEHVAAIEREIGTSWMGYENIHGAVAEVAQHIGDLERGDWNAIESEPVQRYIRANHDSFYVRERGVTNLAVFSPNQVKSASGNDGSYSREDNDIRRSEMRPNTENLDTALRRMDKFVTAFEAKQVKASDVQVLGPTPTVLQALGAEPLNIAIDGHTINKVLVDQNKHAHLITAAMLRDLPRGLYDPLMVFDSPDPKTGLPGKLFVTEIDDRRKNPIVGAVHLSKQGARMVINEITSYYGLENFMTREKTSPSRLEYIRNDEALDLSTTLRSLNLSLVVQKARELGRNIQTEQDIVNQYGDRYSTPRSRLTGQPINQSWPDPDMTDWDDFVRKMQDKMVDTKRVIKAIREAGVAIAEKFDPYMQEILYHGRAASRVKNFADTELRQLLEDMSHRGVVMQDLNDYLWARHAPERNAANARSNPAITDGSGMTDAQAADILAGRAVTINGRTIQLSAQTLRGAAALATRVDAITNRTLDLLVEYKLETQATIDTWKRTYAHYAPLKRDMESDANYSGAFNLGLGTGKGFDIRGAASRRALGSKRSVVDILANVAMQRERAIVRGEKNRVSQAVYGLALTAPNPEFWIPVNPALNKGLSPAALAKLQAELVSIGVNPLDAQNIAREPVERYIDPNTGLEATRINPRLRNRDDVLSVRINGEDRYVMFSNKERAQRMVAGLKNLDADQLGAFLQTAAIGTRWFASVNTQFNPIFGITNGLRDLSTGMLNLSSTPLSANRAEIARNAFSALKGIYLDLRDHRAGRQPTSQWAQLFEQFALDGGQTGYRDMFQNSKARADEIAKELKHAGKGNQWVTGGEKHSAVFGWLSDYNTAVENAVRLSAYKAALDRGMTREAAAALAKNLTVNFNKKGLAATQTGALYAFFNAAVQGTARMAETMTTDGKLNTIGQKIVYGGIVLGVMQATLGMLAGWDDEEPPQYLREKNFLIPDLLTGSDKYLSIPMPLGFHVIPSVGRIATEWMMSGFKDPGKRLTRLAGVLLDAFNPIGGTGSIGQMLSPTITDPIIALGENKDWTGKPVFKEDFSKMQPTPGWTRTKDTASPISRWLSYAMNYATGGGKYEIGLLSPTPDQIDYLVGQATGGVGREILKTAQYVGAKVTGEEMPLYKTPLGVGRFVGETKGQASETSRFYDNLRRIGEHKSALEEMKDARDGDALMRYLERHPDARLVQTADKAQREIGYLRRQKRELIEKGASKERVKLIEDKITGLTRRYNEVLAAKR